jgi:hypothetical protein
VASRAIASPGTAASQEFGRQRNPAQRHQPNPAQETQPVQVIHVRFERALHAATRVRSDGTLVMPMTVLVEQYWREISWGFAQHDIPVRHFVLHADQDTLRKRIEGDTFLAPPHSV